jgi:hypothetical protein
MAISFLEDVFISEVNQITSEEVVTLLDFKLIDPTAAAARFHAMSLALNPDTTYEEICDAMVEHRCHSELVAVVADIKLVATIETMRFIDKWNCEDYNYAFIHAAREGRIDVMKVLKDWGAKYLEGAMVAAVEAGQLEAMTLLRHWGVLKTNSFLPNAAKFGQIEALKLLKSWGATDYYWAVYFAANYRQFDALKLLKDWGSRNYKWVLATSPWLDVEVKNLLTEWIRDMPPVRFSWRV